MELDRSSENMGALKDAEKKLKMSQRKDYYKILGIDSKTVSPEEIKKAYRKKALLHHPGQCVININ